MKVVLIPSVSAGLGHIGRTATLARTLTQLDPTVTVEYVLDTDRLRPFNVDAARRTGFRVTLLPSRSRDSRDAIVRACLEDADVIVDDTSRYLVPLRNIVPHAAWISIPMYPLGDELFMDWPFLAQTDGIIWAYPPALDFPPELDLLGTKVLRTGPFLELAGVPDRSSARAALAWEPDDEVIVYAPRGMSFGRDFGETVLASVIGAAERLRTTHPRLRVALLAVNSRDEIRAPGVPDELPPWVTVQGTLPHVEMLRYIRAADIAVTEGSNMTQEAAALGIPIMMVPGTIYETWLLGTRLGERGAARIEWIERVTPETIAGHFQAILDDPAQRQSMVTHARALIQGGGGVATAAQLVLQTGQAYARRERLYRLAHI